MAITKPSRKLSRRYNHDFRSCSRTYATLLIYHETISPAEISTIIGLRPDRTGSRGDRASLGRTVPRNYWAKSTYRKHASKDVRFHVDTILDKLRGREAKLRKLRRQGCELAISCFWESASGNGGPVLDVQFLMRLARFSITLEFDVWLDLPCGRKSSKA